jgi:diadenosine tetraphosphate (Ap4A) HIT family hydrolase
MSCLLCERLKMTQERSYSYFIHEFNHSFLYLGEHQYYPGYCVLVTKGHFKEMTELPDDIGQELFQEMMQTHRALEKVFTPTKMNMCSLGNVVPHVHWHFFPRYGEDPDFKNPPWLQMQHFDSAKVTPQQREEMIRKVQMALTVS